MAKYKRTFGGGCEAVILWLRIVCMPIKSYNIHGEELNLCALEKARYYLSDTFYRCTFYQIQVSKKTFG